MAGGKIIWGKGELFKVIDVEEFKEETFFYLIWVIFTPGLFGKKEGEIVTGMFGYYPAILLLFLDIFY